VSGSRRCSSAPVCGDPSRLTDPRATCPLGHHQSILDWEIGQAYRSWRGRYGEHEVLDRVRHRWFDELTSRDKDPYFLVGNARQHPTAFMVLGVVWPPRTPPQGLLFSEASGPRPAGNRCTDISYQFDHSRYGREVTGRPPAARGANAATARRLGAHLRTLRPARGLGREQAAAAAGISPVALARIEQERTVDPGLFTIAALAEVLDTTVNDLLAAARRTPAPPFVSIGYEGHTLDSLIAELTHQQVTTLADVRLNAVSRRPGFSKNRLRDGLAAAGIGYPHLRALGNPQHNRAAFHHGDVDEGCRIYRSEIRTPEGRDALATLAALAERQPTAVLCVERDEKACHRQVILELAARPATS
jgi:transcriptional regulator with XRE-family HTH domain